MFDAAKSCHNNFLDIVYKPVVVNLVEVNNTAIIFSMFGLIDFRFIFNHFCLKNFLILFLSEKMLKSVNSFFVSKLPYFVKYHLELLWSYILTQKFIQRFILFLSFSKNAETNTEF